MAAETPTEETVGSFVCSCLWSGKLSFSPDEVAALEGNLKRYIGPCPECKRDALQLVNDKPDERRPSWDKSEGDEGDGTVDDRGIFDIDDDEEEDGDG
jgi:hypothetical protein